MSKKSAKTNVLTWMCVVVPLALGHRRQVMINFWCRPAGPAVECFELVHCVGQIILVTVVPRLCE